MELDIAHNENQNFEVNSNENTYSRTPQVLKIDYTDNKPKTSIIKSTLKNTLIHVIDMDVNPYQKKYNKYKAKYYHLKKSLQNI